MVGCCNVASQRTTADQRSALRQKQRVFDQPGKCIFTVLLEQRRVKRRPPRGTMGYATGTYLAYIVGITLRAMAG